VEIVRREKFALNDGEVDLHLVEPTGMVRSVNRNNRRPAGLQSLDALLAAVHRAIIDDPKHTFGRAIGLLVHNLTDQTIKVLDAVPGCATTEDFGAPDVPGGKVDPSSLALIFVLDASWKGRGGRKRRVFPTFEYSAFRQRKVQNPEDPGVVLAKHPGRDRGSEPPFPKTMDRAGKSSFDNAKVEWRLG